MRDRTADLLRARQALSQLSYSPFRMVGLGRFELPTSPLSGVRSNQLSYRPIVMVCHWLVSRSVTSPCSLPTAGVRSNQLSYRPAVYPKKRIPDLTPSLRAASASQHRDTVASTE